MIAGVQTGGARLGASVASRSDLSATLVVAAGVLVFHAALSGRYGFHRDELYYLAAGRHPALGYVDQPPLVPLFAKAVTAVTGAHLWPLRLVAGAVHAAVVILAAAIAREFGGGGRALALAALATATAPLLLATGGLFQTVVFDQLWWALALLLVVRILAAVPTRAGGWPSVSPLAPAWRPSGALHCSHWGWRPASWLRPWVVATCAARGWPPVSPSHWRCGCPTSCGRA